MLDVTTEEARSFQIMGLPLSPRFTRELNKGTRAKLQDHFLETLKPATNYTISSAYPKMLVPQMIMLSDFAMSDYPMSGFPIGDPLIGLGYIGRIHEVLTSFSAQAGQPMFIKWTYLSKHVRTSPTS